MTDDAYHHTRFQPDPRRRVLWQIVTESTEGTVACLVALEGSRAGLEALYD